MMKPNRIYSKGLRAKRREAGVTLLDVVLAIAVFSFGMLALVQLQGNLTRSSADANTRSVAANIAEEIVERLRAFRSVGADPDNGLWDYEEMDSDTLDLADFERGGIEYDVDVTVDQFWWDEENETFVRTETSEPPVGLESLAYADFKLLRLDVSWDDRENYVDDENTADLSSGVVTVYEIIPSAPPILGAKLASSLDEDTGPPVTYNPGDNPDIIALQLNGEGTKFKESTSVAPKVFREDIVETWFDVVTYSKALGAEQGTFLRREEFVAVSCACNLWDTPDNESDYGLTPALWNGVDYTEGLRVPKLTGTPVNSIQQSAFCSVCCRDHHDAGSDNAEEVYNLAYVGNDGDHSHYDYDLILGTPAQVGDTYVEACRLVRKDGFMRVTQDVSQKTLIGFPEGYLEFDEGAVEYSAYVIDAVGEYYGANDQGDFPQPVPPAKTGTEFPARTAETGTIMPTVAQGADQQMRARSVYADYLTADAQEVIQKCFIEDPPASDCATGNASSALEIYPFFDLQMTYLANWHDESANGLIVSSGKQSRFNQAIVTDNPATVGPEYDRGWVALTPLDTEGLVNISINSYSGNLGLTATSPINDVDSPTRDDLYVKVNSSENPVPPIGQTVSGSLTFIVRKPGGGPGNLAFLSEAAICGNTSTEWSCVVPPSGASLTISGYYQKNPRVYVCSELGAGDESDDGRSTTFTLPPYGGSADIVVTDNLNACPGG